jgi:endonuclease-3
MAKKKGPETDPKRHAKRVVNELARLYPDSHCALVHNGAYQLLVATILSAQCTDVRVNLVTPALFERFPNPQALARADLEEVEALIRTTGFFRSKAKNLVAMARQVVEQHDGEIPRDLDELTALAGVGRKTANVVLGNAFGLATGVVVDTHVKRLSFRLGLTTAKDPSRIERDLMAVVSSSEWVDLSHRLIEHGRKTCKAIRPRCEACALEAICPKNGVHAPASKGEKKSG